MTGAMLRSGGGMVKPVSDGYDAWYIDQVLNICLARWLNPDVIPELCRQFEPLCQRKNDRLALVMLRKGKNREAKLDEVFGFIEKLLGNLK
jgi:hypothetical protein